MSVNAKAHGPEQAKLAEVPGHAVADVVRLVMPWWYGLTPRPKVVTLPHGASKLPQAGKTAACASSGFFVPVLSTTMAGRSGEYNTRKGNTQSSTCDCFEPPDHHFKLRKDTR